MIKSFVLIVFFNSSIFRSRFNLKNLINQKVNIAKKIPTSKKLPVTQKQIAHGFVVVAIPKMLT